MVDLARFKRAFALLETVETDRHVVDWTHNSLNLWPIAKYVLVKNLIGAFGRGFDQNDRLKTYPAFAEKMREPRLQWQRADPTHGIDIADFTGWSPNARSSALFFGNRAGFVHAEGRSANYHFDIIRDHLEHLKCPTTAFVQGAKPSSTFLESGVFSSTFGLDTLLHEINVRSTVPFVTKRFFGKYFEVFARFSELIATPISDLIAYIDVMIGRTIAMRAILEPLLAEGSTKAVFMSNYASVFGWALASLCRERRVPLVDIQHGLEGPHNGAYAWGCAPSKDWNTVPQAHLCWTQTDLFAFANGHPGRRAFLMGPSWFAFLDYLQNDRVQDPTFKKFQEAYLRSYQADEAALLDLKRPSVLYASQFQDDVLRAETLNEGIEGQVIYRPHPTLLVTSDDEALAARLDALQATLGRSSALPALLRSVDAICTGHSAMLLEAASIGLPVFANSGFAELIVEHYADEIGDLVSVGDFAPETVQSALSDSVGRRKENPTAGAEIFLHDLTEYLGLAV